MDGSKEEKGMRQKAKRFLMFIAGICLLLLIMCSFVLYLFFPDLLHPETQETSEATTELFAMDTYITMTAYGPDAVIALTKATDKLTELEQLWSVTDVNSDIYAVNHSGGQALSVSYETIDMLSFTAFYIGAWFSLRICLKISRVVLTARLTILFQ